MIGLYCGAQCVTRWLPNIIGIGQRMKLNIGFLKKSEPAGNNPDLRTAPTLPPVVEDAGTTPQINAVSEMAFLDQINLVHKALYGWPCDHLTPIADYLACQDIHEVALKMIDADRFRWDIKDKVGLWPHDKWVMTEFKTFKIWVNLFDSFVSFGVLHGNWEDAEVNFMLSCLKPGDGMIDAGANIGVYTIQAANAVGQNGKVYAFEPMRKTFDMLSRTVTANGFEKRCMLFNEGLGAHMGTGSFHLSSHATNPGSSYISIGTSGEHIQVRPVDSIDYDCPIRFIKIDVEGFEPHIINGARQTIAKHAPVILTEFFPRSLREIGGVSGAGYVAMLEEIGYSMTVFSDNGEREIVTSGNAARFDDLSSPINLVCMPTSFAR
jgi:FkbM family methyltransferase